MQVTLLTAQEIGIHLRTTTDLTERTINKFVEGFIQLNSGEITLEDTVPNTHIPIRDVITDFQIELR
jgi:hypothetical protein